MRPEDPVSGRQGWWLLATGVVSILGQVVLLRELQVAFFGSELITILGMGVWLLGTALGAAARRRGSTPAPRHLCGLLLFIAVALPGAVVLARSLRLLFGAMPGTYLGFGEQLVGICVVLVPVSFCLGLLFQWAARIYVAPGRLLAGAYGIESVGGLLGGALATLFLYAGLQNLTAAVICSCVGLAGAWSWREAGRLWHVARGAMSAALAAALVLAPAADRALTAVSHPHLLASHDSPYARITITEQEGRLALFQNDALAFDSEGVAAEELVHLAALQHPAPRRVLILGGGLTGTTVEALKHRPAQVEVVELDQSSIDLVTPRLPADQRAVWERPEVQLRIADPRAFLITAGRYDLILIGMPEPDSGQTNRFFTREMFALCRAHLEAGGVLALSLPGAENLWSPLRLRQTASILRGLEEVFDDTLLLPGTTSFLFASDTPLAREPSLLQQRLAKRGVEARLITPAYVEYALTNDRVAQVAESLAATEVPTNSDSAPICYQLTIALWLAKFFPVVALLDLSTAPEARLGGAGLAIAGLLGLLLALRRRAGARRLALATIAGFAGMVIETVLILSYQIQRGVMFADLGLLLTAFMAGLAAGGLALDRLARRGNETPALPRRIGALVAIGLTLLALATAGAVGTGGLGGLGLTTLLLGAAGLGVAGLFAYASLAASPGQDGVVAPLYAADLIGGCAGCVIGTLLLIPVLGLSGSCLLIAGGGLAALLAV